MYRGSQGLIVAFRGTGLCRAAQVPADQAFADFRKSGILPAAELRLSPLSLRGFDFDPQPGGEFVGGRQFDVGACSADEVLERRLRHAGFGGDVLDRPAGRLQLLHAGDDRRVEAGRFCGFRFRFRGFLRAFLCHRAAFLNRRLRGRLRLPVKRARPHGIAFAIRRPAVFVFFPELSPGDLSRPSEIARLGKSQTRFVPATSFTTSEELTMTASTTACADRICEHRDAGFPVVAVETVEERRLSAELLGQFVDGGAPLYRIASTGVLVDLRDKQNNERCAYPAAFAKIADDDDAVLIVHDWQAICKNHAAMRALLDLIPRLKSHGSLVVLLAPHWDFPDELKHEVPILQHGLPTREQLRQSLAKMDAERGDADDSDDELLDAAAGLSAEEAEAAFALSLVESNRLDASRVLAHKMQSIRSSGYLEFAPFREGEAVGGLGNLMSFLTDEVEPAKDDGPLAVRGLMLVGVPGTGKSLAARAAGQALKWPVLRMDVSSLKGSLVGQSEANMRAALQLAEAVSPCVLWIDEIEKAVGGFASSAQTDGGTTLGMIGLLLTWLQEHQSRIVTLATCNDHTKLPPELTRAGRFDATFFVDLPSVDERLEIANVHLQRYACETVEDVNPAAAIAEQTDGFTGAELEAVVKSAARRTRRQLTADAITAAVESVIPISKTRSEEIAQLREWGATRMQRANTPHKEASRPARKVRKR